MKKLIGFVVLFAALVLGGYYGMGVLTERALKKNIDVLNQSSEITVMLEEYHRGWFSSNATLDWTFNTPASVIQQNGNTLAIPAKTYHTKMPLVIHHGPIIFADSSVKFGLGYARSTVALPDEYRQKFEADYSAESIKPNLDLSVFVSYVDNTCIRLSIPAFKLIAKQGNKQFNWEGMAVEVNVSSNKKQISGDLNLSGLNWVQNDINGSISNVKSDYALNRTAQGLYVGDANLFFPKVIVTKGDTKLVEVDRFDIHSSSNVSKGLFSSTLKAALEKLVLNQKNYTASSFAVAIRNLDVDTLVKLNDQIAKADNNQQAFLVVLPELPALLSKGAELEISDLNIGTPDGQLKANLLIKLPNENVSNPFQLMQKIQGNGVLNISANVLKAVMKDSIKQKIQAQANANAQTAVQSEAQPQQVQSELVQENQPPLPPVENQKESALPATDPAAPPAPTSVPDSASKTAPAASVVDIDQQASTQADQRIADLVNAGVLLVKGTDYVLAFKITDGKLLINDKPFNPAMIKL